MKHRFAITSTLITLALLTMTCSSWIGNGEAMVRLGFSHAGARDVLARPLTPAQSIVITVAGPDMSTIEETVGPTVTQVDLSVPAGPSRTVTVSMNMPPADPGAVLVFRGSATLDLEAGSSQTVSIHVVPAETKILVPDMLNNRIVQIDDMTGAGWITRVQADFPLMYFYPTDMDLDALGRIYIATSYSSSSAVYRINDLDPASTPTTVASSIYNIPCLAVDPFRDWVYYIDTSASGTLKRVKTDGTGDTTLVTTGIDLTNTLGIDVDAEGCLYFYGSISSVRTIIRYDPASASPIMATIATTAVGITSSYILSDVMVKDDYVYLCAYYNDGMTVCQSKVISLSKATLTHVDDYGFGPFTDETPGPAEIPGAHRFLAIRNKKFHVTDEWRQSFNPQDRIVEFNDFSDPSLDLFGSTGSGVGQFVLTYSC